MADWKRGLRRVLYPAYEARVVEQMQQETDRLGLGKLDALLKAGDTWTVGGAAS